ncbi:uncharacterized protein LOC141721638 isoform X2 [Apium graveolens]|uniref:uncharacterized protein LOC141721638 isoform X2 n=1 Tax=Apium graveolens TaxID=4045 RepID=UPI003D7A8E3A
MDALLKAYSTAASDDEEEDNDSARKATSIAPPHLPPSKKLKPDYSFLTYNKSNYTKHTPHIPPVFCNYNYSHNNNYYNHHPPEPPPPMLPGRYVSKRERAAAAASIAPPDPLTTTPTTSSSSPAHLLASAGMDHTICIWNPWSKNEKKARVLIHHTAAVKDVKWSALGLSLLSCGYDCTSRLFDIEKGLETHVFKEDQVVGVVKFHPNNSNLFLSGGSKGVLKLWDIRTQKVVHQYVRGLGPILDVEFIKGASQFISSSDVSKGNVTENSIMVWDVSRQVPLSNQVYSEAYTCPSIKCHTSEQYFVAQSNGNYIAIFSAKVPFKLDKYRRFESHGVSGFPVKCDFNLDGEQLASGSSDGCIYFYNSRSTELIKKVKLYEQACIDVAFHPIMPNVIASCSWNGDISVLE